MLLCCDWYGFCARAPFVRRVYTLTLSWKVPYALDRPLTSLPPGMLMSTSHTKHQTTNPQIHARHCSWHVTHTPLNFHTAPNGSDCQFPLAQHLGKQSCSLLFRAPAEPRLSPLTVRACESASWLNIPRLHIRTLRMRGSASSDSYPRYAPH